MQQTVELARKRITSSYAKLGDERLKFWIVTIGILVLSGLAFIFLSANWPKFNRAEVFFAECVREMRLADTLVTPLYHGTPFFDKPILMYWSIAAGYMAGGINHLSARIPSILAALVTIAATAIGGRHLFGARAGTMAAAALASSFMFMSFAALCMSDMLLVMFDTITLAFLYIGIERSERRTISFWIAAMSAGLAFLTKGPVGIVLPAISFFAYLTLTRQWRIIDPIKHVIPCALITALAASPWFWSAYRENGAGALSYFFIRENLQRFAGSTYDTHKPIYFMLVSLFTGMLPWSIFLPPAAVMSWKERAAAGRKHLYLWLWIATVTIFFSLSRGKIDYYVLPVYPAACILVGAWLTRACDQRTNLARITATIAGVVLCAAAVIAPVVLGSLLGSNPLNWFLFPLALALGGGGMIICLAQNELRKAWKMVYVTVCLVTIAVSLQLLPWLTSKQGVIAFVPQIKKQTADRLGVHSALANWVDEITFQTGVEPLPVKDNAMATRFLGSPQSGLLIIPEKDYEQIPIHIRESARILDRKPFIGRSLNPGYLIKRMGHPEEYQLLLVGTNL